MSLIGVLIAALVGLAVGLVIGLLVRGGRAKAARGARPVPGRAASGGRPLPQRVLDRADVGYSVLDSAGHVLYANPRARELGVVRAGLPDRRIMGALARADLGSDPVDVELGSVDAPTDLIGPRRNPMAVQAVLRSLGDGLVLVSASDETEALRLESVRRDFVANVSHELKTPVAAITLLAEAVSDASDDPESVQRFAQRLVRESNRLGTLVTELIVLSRLQGADPLPELSVVEVDSLIAEALARTSGLTEASGTQLIAGGTTGLLVRGDRPMLLTALTNLVSNAIHYSPSGSTVSISRVDREGVVEIAVTDRGIGIAPEHQQRVFERFFRVDSARSRATGGTGLGLAIVKHVAANHGGQAKVWSKLGLGSTFTLRLPEYVPDVPGESDPDQLELSAGAGAVPPDTAQPSAETRPAPFDLSDPSAKAVSVEGVS